MPGTGDVWLEVTALGSFDPPRFLSMEGRREGIRLEGWKGGLALVCSGGEGIEVDCRQRYLAATPTVRPELRRGARIAGIVVIGSTPVRGARVGVVPKRLTSRRLLTLPLALDRTTGKLVREVRTDGAGRFLTPQLAPGEYRLEINSPGGLILHGEPFSLPPREALLPKGAANATSEAVFDSGQIAIPAGARVEISVHDAAGRPIAGAKVGGSQGDDPETTRFFETATGAGGRAVLSGLDPARSASFACSAAGYLDVRQRFAALPLAVDCPLAPLSALEGTVLDEADRPIAGTVLSLAPGGRAVSANPQGRFSFQGLTPGTYRLTAAAPGFRPKRVSVELSPGARRELAGFVLEPGRELHGRVEDARTKDPVAGARLSSLDPPGAVSSESADDGTFAFSTDDTQPVVLTVTAAGYPPTTVEVPREERAEAPPWNIELSPGGRIRAEVWDEETDGPCQGCSVMLTGPSGGSPVVTDSTGAAVSEPLAEGVYAVSPEQVRSLGWVVQVSGGQDVKQVEVRMGETAVVHFGERRRRVVVRLHPDPAGWQLVATAAAGSGVAEILSDGSRQVVKPAGEAVRLTLVCERTNVELGALAADDDSQLFDLDLPPTEVGGTVRGPSDSASVGLLSMADPSRHASTPLQPGGRFSIPFLPPGPYSLVVDGRAVRTLRVDAEGVTDLGEIDLK